MTERPTPHSDPPWRLLGALALATLASRVAVILYLRTWLGDAGAYEHEAIARSLVAGEGFRFTFFGDAPLPSSHQAPVFPWILAGAYALFGVGSPLGKLAAQGVGAVLAAVSAAALGWIAFRWWGRRVMIVAMVGFLAYPAFLYMPTRIQAVNWSLAFLVLFLAAFVESARKPASPGWAAAAGLAGGLGALGEPILVAPFGLCWLWLVWTSPRRGGAALAALLFVLVLTPWTVRNTLVHGRPVFVKSTFGYVFWEGNHAGASGTDKRRVEPETAERLAWRLGGALETERLLDEARAQAVSVDENLTSEDREELRRLPTETARVAWFSARATEELRQAPRDYLARSARRLWMLLWFDDTNPRSFVLAYRLPYLLLGSLAVAGMAAALRRRVRLVGSGYWVVALLGLFLVHTLVITSARFRLPLEALYLLPASLAVDGLWRRFTRGGGGPGCGPARGGEGRSGARGGASAR